MSETIKEADKLVLFTCVAKHLNFRTAAAELNMPVATLSRKISELEKHLGLKLFQRTTRSVSLTRLGNQLYTKIDRPLKDLETAILQIQEQQQDVYGQVRIATTSTLAFTNIMPVLPQLQRDYPRLRIELLLDAEVVDLRFEQIDFAIRAGKIEDTSLVARRLGRHVFARYTTARWLDVTEAPYITYDDELLVGDEPAWLTVKDLELIYKAVLAGYGEAYLPTTLCAAEEAAGKLIRREQAPDYAVEFYLVYPSRHYLSLGVRCVMDALVDFAELINRDTHYFS